MTSEDRQVTFQYDCKLEQIASGIWKIIPHVYSNDLQALVDTTQWILEEMTHMLHEKGHKVLIYDDSKDKLKESYSASPKNNRS